MECSQLRTIKKISVRCTSILMLCAVVAACGGSNLVQHSPPQSFSREPEPKTIAVLPPAPRIDAINQTTVTDGTGIELVGSGFEDGAVAELLAANGSIIGSVAVAGDAVRRTAVLPASITNVGSYEVRIRNINGQYSNLASFSLVPSTQEQSQAEPDQCSSDLTGSSMTLYLGGGDAEKLFDRYMAQDSDITGKLPYRMKIKFYEQHGSELALQVVGLGEFEDLFVESRNDFFERLKKQLRGRTAELTPAVQQDAAKEKAQYFQCKFNQTSGI